MYAQAVGVAWCHLGEKGLSLAGPRFFFFFLTAYWAAKMIAGKEFWQVARCCWGAEPGVFGWCGR